jgi:hypothetical protein
MLCLPSVGAQDPPAAKAGQDVTIIIEQQQVQFTARTAVEWMQLQVFNSSGEPVFDSGAVAAGEIKWSFRNGSDEAVKSGLYAYTLSIKEAGKDTARVRRGHFIVDRARERDGAKDRLWITSRDADIGAELSVAREEGITVSSASTNAERTVERSTGGVKRDAGGRAVETETQTRSEAAKPISTAAPAGTAGRIVKYATAFDLGDSVIAEQNGNIGIGTATPVTTLDVRGRMTLDPGAGNPVVLFTAASGGEQNRFLELINSPTTRSASGLKAGGVLVADDYNFAQPKKNDLIVKGVVGIETANPESELHVHGLNPVITLSTAAGAKAYIQNAGGNLVFKPSGFGFCCAAMVIKPNTGNVEFTGNVGIGTANPATKLHVEAGGDAEMTIKSGTKRAVLALGNGFGPANYVWRLESGLYGKANMFGIYNAAAEKSGLEIDGNLQVYVKALQITGGADFAEHFDVRAETAAEIQPGLVMTIDPAAPGKLALSRRAYDRRVAGIISGAGDVKPGMTMGAAGTLADGKHPVALSGRVYVWVDATRGAVKPGDLLTTSATPGHAMKASNPSKAQGAIIGKAMTELKSGRGLVLVLVTLQ